jgi:hypothetical protein
LQQQESQLLQDLHHSIVNTLSLCFKFSYLGYFVKMSLG